MTSPIWTVQPGDTLIREQIHGTYGGNRQSGISGSSTTANVFVYSDHDKAAANGYDFDGWDGSRRLYFYTGEGKTGDQQMARGNKAIADHRSDSTALRLFVAVGNQPGSTTRMHRYIGEFTVDPELPYLVKVAPGTDGVPRNVFVFRLRPVAAVTVDAGDHISALAGASLAAEVGAVAVDAVPVEATRAERSQVEKFVSGPVIQREAHLTQGFQKYLEEHRRVVKRYRIAPVGSAALYSDLADTTTNVLYEAKGAADRMSVRLALGQVLDYGRYVEGARLAVLLPEAPPADLVELLEDHDVGCVVETTPGNFLDMTVLNRCP